MNHLKGYATAEQAARSKAARQPGAWIDEGCWCGRVHVRQKQERRPGNSDISDAVRALVLRRDRRACVCCGLSVIGQRYSLGHRLRASQGGRPVPSNLITLLGWGGEQCHGRIDNRADPADEAKGYTIRSGGDPLLVPVMIFSDGGSGVSMYLTDAGEYSPAPPEGSVAA